MQKGLPIPMETVFDIKAYIYCWSFDKLLHILQQK